MKQDDRHLKISKAFGVSQQTSELAKKALQSFLYERNGLLENTLVRMRRRPTRSSVIVLLENVSGVAVGVCVIHDQGAIQIYIKHPFRQQGWGSRLVEAAKELFQQPNLHIKAGPGSNFLSSVEFWRKCGIPVSLGGHRFPLSMKEASQLIEKRRVLCCKRADELSDDVVESVYLANLFNPELKHGIQGQLKLYWTEKHLSFWTAHYHLDVEHGPVSFATLTPYGQSETDLQDSHVYLLRVYVDPRFRRQGLAGELLSQVHETLMQKIGSSAYVILGHYNPESKALFARHSVLPIGD